MKIYEGNNLFKDGDKFLGSSFVAILESGETKPENAGEGDLCIELDTGKVFYFSASAEDWKEVGYNA